MVPKSVNADKELVHRFFDELWNKGNLDIYDEIAPSLGIKGYKEWVRSHRAAFGDFHVTILDLLGDGDQVALHWRVTAVHQGDYLGVAATNRPVTFQGMSLLRIVDDKIVDDIGYWDELAILKQLGVTTRQEDIK
jgi:predicted ester cyclase